MTKSTERKGKTEEIVLTPLTLRAALRDRGVADSLSEFAKQIGKSRSAIYFALERPQRFPLVFRKIQKALHD